MAACSLAPDILLKDFLQNAQDIIKCAQCQALAEDPVKAGCDHIFCRECLNAKYVNFDTQETFTTCPTCKAILQKSDIVSITPKLAELNRILKKCVLDFCDDTNLDLENYLGQSDKIPKTYSKQNSDVPDTVQISSDILAKEKVEHWLVNNIEPVTQETASTQSFECSSSAQKSLISKESYDILPAASPPPLNEDARAKRGRGRGRGRGQRKSSLPISSGDRSDAKKPPTEASPRHSLSPTFDVLIQRPSTSTPLTGPRRRGRHRRPASALSLRSIHNETIDKEDEPMVMEVDIFDPGSPELKKADEEHQKASNESTASASESSEKSKDNKKLLNSSASNDSTASASERSENLYMIQPFKESKEAHKPLNASLRFIRIPSAKNIEESIGKSSRSCNKSKRQTDHVLDQIGVPDDQTSKQILVDYSVSSIDACPKEPRNVNNIVNFVRRGCLFPKKKPFIRERQLIPFIRIGKLDIHSTQEARDFHECPQEAPTKTYSSATTQTCIELKETGVQTDEKRNATIETQTDVVITCSDAIIQTCTETNEMGIQTEQEQIESKDSESTQDSSVGVFHEQNKRPRVLSSSEDEEPKRKRTTFDIEPPRPVVEAPKTVIMESDEESEGILAPTPPRKAPPKRVFTCSSLQRIQVKLVQDWAKRIGAEVIPTYTPAVTHVIVQVDPENCAQRTLKFLYGVAAGKWIVSVDWVHVSMREGCVADEELFEALDMEGEAGPFRSRTRSKTSKLFQAFEFCCQEPYTDVTADQLRELLDMSGAATAPSPGQIKKNRRHALIVVQTDDTNEAEVQRRAATWFDRYQVLSVSREWVLDCLAAYKLMSIRPHLIGKHSDSFLRMLRFDEQLLA